MQWQEAPAGNRGGITDLNAQLIAAGVALADEVLCAADEVCESSVGVLACSHSDGISLAEIWLVRSHR